MLLFSCAGKVESVEQTKRMTSTTDAHTQGNRAHYQGRNGYILSIFAIIHGKHYFKNMLMKKHFNHTQPTVQPIASR